RLSKTFRRGEGEGCQRKRCRVGLHGEVDRLFEAFYTINPCRLGSLSRRIIASKRRGNAMKKRFGVGSMGILVPAACLFANLAAQAGDAKTITIGFLLPCTKCADRFEQKDRPFFIDSVAKIDPSIKVIVTNAEGDTARQLAQGEAALTRGANVLVVMRGRPRLSLIWRIGSIRRCWP